ncbi:hypothetical protein FNW07_06330 [Flavobacterium sp. GT3R68]|nr:hypothetical protein EKL32_24955 [Flavobacterium sp. GSN2]TRW92664.1 hypothetical protein FNW07_06330 [Flavobacterium sp. GT3R68]
MLTPLQLRILALLGKKGIAYNKVKAKKTTATIWVRNSNLKKQKTVAAKHSKLKIKITFKCFRTGFLFLNRLSYFTKL